MSLRAIAHIRYATDLRLSPLARIVSLGLGGEMVTGRFFVARTVFSVARWVNSVPGTKGNVKDHGECGDADGRAVIYLFLATATFSLCLNQSCRVHCVGWGDFRAMHKVTLGCFHSRDV